MLVIKALVDCVCFRLNVTRGMFRYCDFMAGQHPGLLNRAHLENTVIRQFWEHPSAPDGGLVRLYLDLPFVVTAPKPLPAFSNDKPTGIIFS